MTSAVPTSPRSLLDDDAFIETPRLKLREATSDDAAVILRLLNEPSFLQNIGDKGVRNLADACEYIRKGPIDSYARHGFGLYLVLLKEDGTAVGTCGLLQRETFDYPDIGFAFLPEFWSRGYALESAQAVIKRGKSVLGITRFLAVTAPNNEASISLLTKLGFLFEKTLDSFGDFGKSKLYALDTKLSPHD